MSNDIIDVENNLKELEPILTNKLSAVKDFNDLVKYHLFYSSNYLPTLEFLVENCEDNEISKYANFGIMIDQLLDIKLEQLLTFITDQESLELSKIKNINKNDLDETLSKLYISRKVQICTIFASQMSILRDQCLTQASTKYDAINKIITWSNFFSHFLHEPILHDIYMDDETIDIAERDLLEARKRIQTKNKNYDKALAKHWKEKTDYSEEKLVDIPKYFIGPKLAWLEAMVGLNIAKILVRNDKNAMANANEYNEKIIDYLTNNTISKNKYAYRENLEIPGPTANLNKILASKEFNFTTLDNMSILCESEKEVFIIIIPSSYSFYVNENTKVKHKLIFDNYEEKEQELPIWRSMFFVKEFCESPADFFIQYKNYICEPQDSSLFCFWLNFSEKINTLINKSKTKIGRVELAFHGFADNKVINALKKIKADTIELIIVYNALSLFEELAKIAGFDVNADLWSMNRLAIAELLIRILLPITKISKEEKNEDIHKIRHKIEGKPVNKKEKLSNDIKEISETANNLFEQLKDTSLNELQKVSSEIQAILKSGLPVEEINEKLKEYYVSLR